MSKCIILVTNFQKSPSAGGVFASSASIFDVGGLKLRNLVKYCCFSNWLWQSRTL